MDDRSAATDCVRGMSDRSSSLRNFVGIFVGTRRISILVRLRNISRKVVSYGRCRAHQPSLAKREKAATPQPTWAKAGAARELRLGKPRFPTAKPPRFSLPTKISKTTPCKVAGSSLAWMLCPPRHLTRRANHRHYSIIAQFAEPPMALPRRDYRPKFRH
jgi:hypothetical protein